MDIEKISVKSGGKTLLLTIRMWELASDWLASNGFDHVAFNIYFDIPNQIGETVLPMVNSDTPKDFEWNLLWLLIFGGFK